MPPLSEVPGAPWECDEERAGPGASRVGGGWAPCWALGLPWSREPFWGTVLPESGLTPPFRNEFFARPVKAFLLKHVLYSPLLRNFLGIGQNSSDSLCRITPQKRRMLPAIHRHPIQWGSLPFFKDEIQIKLPWFPTQLLLTACQICCRSCLWDHYRTGQL